MKEIFTDIFTDVMNFIFPPHCPECDAYVEERGGWCDECLSAALKVMRVPIDSEMLAALDGAFALGNYRGTLGRLIRRLKFQQDRSVLPPLYTFLQAAKGLFPRDVLAVDVVTPVPLHQLREKERGFNQAELIFAPCFAVTRLLERIRATTPQYELGAAERQKNLKGAFALSEGKAVEGRTILLLDDIMTTGTTFFECAKVLKASGAKRVIALALASDR